MAKRRDLLVASVTLALVSPAAAQEEARAVEASYVTTAPTLPAGVEAPLVWLDRVLLHAGENRRELEAALIRFSPKKQPFEYAAMAWLVTHLEGHGYARFTWFDRYGDPIKVPVEAFDEPATFERYWAALERESGPLQAGIQRFEGDALSLTADELQQHVELAVRAWRERPWTWQLDPALFFEGVLPHRIGNEALDDWRRVLFETFAGIEESLTDPSDPLEAAEWIRRSTRSWVEVAESSLWRPTDQSLREILTSREGRSEDLAHLEVLALRANAIPATIDFVSAWGARRGNHAWSRLLVDGAPVPQLSNRVAKVMRRSFARSKEARPRLEGRSLPVWLTDPHTLDVTDEYVPAQDLELSLPRREGGYYMLAIWDGTDWVPIATGKVLDGGRVRFPAMGPDVLYLPIFSDALGDHVLTDPVSVSPEGQVRFFDGLQFESPGDWGSPLVRAPEHPAELNGLPAAASFWTSSEVQRLLTWKDGSWQQLETQSDAQGRMWWQVPLGRVVLLQPAEGWDAHARPFTMQFERVRWW